MCLRMMAAGATLERFAQLGVHLALDDFGTGYSSLVLPAAISDRHRKDRSHIPEEVPQNPASARSSKRSSSWRMRLENASWPRASRQQSSSNFCASAGCDVAQGFYLARPLSAPGGHRAAASAHAVGRESGEFARRARKQGSSLGADPWHRQSHGACTVSRSG